MVINHKGTKVTIEQSIVGALEVYQDEVREEPLHIDISDSILDATSEERNALNAPEHLIAYAILNISRSTVFGRVLVHAIDTAENSMLARCDDGGASPARLYALLLYRSRFAHAAPIPLPARSGRSSYRYSPERPASPRCVTRLSSLSTTGCGHVSIVFIMDKQRIASSRWSVLPKFGVELMTSRRWAFFHDLFSPQREANLRARLDDFTPAGMETGIIYVS